jgi:hypothetical protein
MTLPPGVTVKLQRALEHFQALNAEVRDFFDAHKDTRPVHPEVDIAEEVIRLRILMPPPPLMMSGIVGDCVANLRSSLDHLVCELAQRQGNDCKQTEFPIFLKESVYRETARNGRPTRRSGLAKVSPINARAQTIIEGLQPYHRLDGSPDSHPLWLLHELSNEDKHRQLSLVVVSPQFVTFEFRLGSASIARLNIPGPIHDGAEIAHFSTLGAVAKDALQKNQTALTSAMGETSMQVYGEYGMTIAFDESGPGKGLLVDATLKDINDFIVHNVVPPLVPFL